MQRRFGWVWAASFMFSAACAITDTEPAGEPPVGEVAQAALVGPSGGPCPDEVCGSNSPVIDKIGFHELNLDGVENVQRLAITLVKGIAQLRRGTASYELHVVGGVITGQRRGKIALQGVDLIGAWIPVHRGSRQYALVIKNVRPMTFFTPPADPFEAYSLAWHEIGSDNDLPLCSDLSGYSDDPTVTIENRAEELMGMTEVESVVYEGDRFDTLTKTTDKGADDRWINIGCAGTMLSKLWLTHNTVHTQAAGLPRAWEQRQATMKLYAADYCGGGYAFTVHGQPLVWQGDSMVYHHAPRTLEARWTEQGAACLYVPRMIRPVTDTGRRLFPDIKGQLATVCGAAMPPACDPNLDPFDYDFTDRVSAHYTF